MNAYAALVNYYMMSNPSDSYHALALRILMNIHELQSFSLYDAAEACFVSTTTVTRFCKHIGFSNFQDFRNNLLGMLEQDCHNLNRIATQYRGGVDNLKLQEKALQDELEKIASGIPPEQYLSVAQALHRASRVIFYASTISFDMRSLISMLFLEGKEVRTFFDAQCHFPEAVDADGNTIAIFLRLEEIRHFREFDKICHKIKQKGAQICTITNSTVFAGNNEFDYLLSYDGSANPCNRYTDQMLLNVILSRLSIIYAEHYGSDISQKWL